MNDNSTPALAGPSEGLGLAPARAALGATSESDAYQQWLYENGESTRLGVASFGWLAWSAAVAAEREKREALEARLREIGDFAHDHSTGPAVPDALWEVRSMAYGA